MAAAVDDACAAALEVEVYDYRFSSALSPTHLRRFLCVRSIR